MSSLSVALLAAQFGYGAALEPLQYDFSFGLGIPFPAYHDYTLHVGIVYYFRLQALMGSSIQGHIASRMRLGTPQAAATDGMLTNQQYELAMTKGLNDALDRFAWEIIKRNLSANNGKKARTLEQLKISTRLLYSTLNKFGGK